MNLDMKKKYLSDVFRKEDKANLDNSIKKKIPTSVPAERDNNKFALDTKYKLRLDEIV